MYRKVRICPKCGKEYNDYPAISRHDNETEICPLCGMSEALEDFLWQQSASTKNRRN